MLRENLSKFCRFYEWICYKSGGFSPASRLGGAGLFLGFSLGFGMDKMSLAQFVYRAVGGWCVSGCYSSLQLRTYNDCNDDDDDIKNKKQQHTKHTWYTNPNG
jgi:hypothetical protein